ncbi:MAG TPA: hypothetical protein VFZ15_00730, partial [Acidimicrobiia bacterium]|nr:hypothetical protein [Acidimicrobiia bacterium]
LRDMVIECLDAAASLAGRPAPGPEVGHGTDQPSPAPDDLKRTVAYDIAGTRALLNAEWSEEEISLARQLPGEIGFMLLDPDTGGGPSFMDAGLWYQAHGFLLERFVLGDQAWESLAFRLWLTRVLAYTENQAQTGFDRAMEYLESTIADYERRALSG